MGQDNVFAVEKSAEDFRFDSQVAGVFDDMVDRSVPFYQEIQRMVGELAADTPPKGVSFTIWGAPPAPPSPCWTARCRRISPLPASTTRRICWRSAEANSPS